MDKYHNILKKIEKSLEEDQSEYKKWNKNYFIQQKERYAKDLSFYSNLDGVKKVLEVGAAPFHVSLCLQELGYDLTIMDIDPSRFQWFIDANKLNVVQCNIETDELEVEDNSFDLIIFTEVFEHLRINPIQTLINLRNKLKPDGLLYLTTPNFFRLANIISFISGKPVVNAYYEFEKLNTLGHMGHVREYSKKEMDLFLNNTGFIIEQFNYKLPKQKSLSYKYRLLTKFFEGTKTHMSFLAKKI